MLISMEIILLFLGTHILWATPDPHASHATRIQLQVIATTDMQSECLQLLWEERGFRISIPFLSST